MQREAAEKAAQQQRKRGEHAEKRAAGADDGGGDCDDGDGNVSITGLLKLLLGNPVAQR